MPRGPVEPPLTATQRAYLTAFERQLRRPATANRFATDLRLAAVLREAGIKPNGRQQLRAARRTTA